MTRSLLLYFPLTSTDLLKALGPGERWIQVHPHGPDAPGQPVLIKDNPDGSASVIGGAGGSLNGLRFTGKKPGGDLKESVAGRADARKERLKRQQAQDRRDGLAASKSKAREVVKLQKLDKRREFVEGVAEALGWGDVQFPVHKWQNATAGAQQKAEAKHWGDLHRKARQAVQYQRQRLLADGEARKAAGIGEVPLTTTDPETITVEDLDPSKKSAGLGFATGYAKRAEAAGLTRGELEKEAAKARPEPTPGRQQAAQARKERGEEIKRELQAIRDPGPQVDPHATVQAKQAIHLLKLEKAMKAAERQSRDMNRAIDKAREVVDPNAYVLEVGGQMADGDAVQELEKELGTLRTRAFLDEVGKAGSREALGRHIGAGAFSSINALSLAASGAALVDRSVVDVLGIGGAAEVLARRLQKDLTPEELEEIKRAAGTFHQQHYMEATEGAIRQAREWQELAQEIEIGPAATGAELMQAQELNAKRRELVGNAQRTLGTVLGEMEANAALNASLMRPARARVQVSMGGIAAEDAITRVRALGLQRGEYALERVSGSTVLTIESAGLDRLAAPVSRDDLQRTRAALDIIEGRHDENGWLPKGVAQRPDLGLPLKPGAAPLLAKPFPQNPRDIRQAVADHIGGMAADGCSPAEIVRGIFTEEMAQRSGDRTAYMAAANELAPAQDAEGNQLRPEEHAEAFERLADEFVDRHYGGTRSALNRQNFEPSAVAADALHRALAQRPEAVAAYKPIGELTPQDQRAIRDAFAAEFAAADTGAPKLEPELAEKLGLTGASTEDMRRKLAELDANEPERMVQDMFGENVNPLHTDWRNERNGLVEALNRAAPTWAKYVETLGNPARAYEAMQGVLRSRLTRAFAEEYNRLQPDAPLKLGKTTIAHDIAHLTALDAEAAERRAAERRKVVDSVRSRVAGRYVREDGVADKADAAQAQEHALQQAQMGLFGFDPPAPEPEPEAEPATQEMPDAESADLKGGERFTLGQAAEATLSRMVPEVGKNFTAGQPVKLWRPSMDGKNVARQRAVKLIKANKRMMLAMGAGSGKTSISLAAFTDLKEEGKAHRGVFVVPSVVQGNFSADALTMLEPGKYNWHCVPGASRDERIAAMKDKGRDFVVVTHQAFRDDVLHLASERSGMTPEATAAAMDAMKPEERAAFVKGVLEAEGIDFDFSTIDEGHNLLNRQGKANSAMANVIDAVTDNMEHHVSMTADPVKNDVSELFDVFAKLDRKRFSDRDAFMRKYGADTGGAREALRQEMARYFYTSAIDSGASVTKREIPVAIGGEHREKLEALAKAAGRARLASLRGKVDVEAIRELSPGSFEGVDPGQHREVAEKLAKAVGVLRDAAEERAITAAKVDSVATAAAERRGKAGVVFCRSLEGVSTIAKRLEAEGHKVLTLTGGDSTQEKDRKKRAYQAGQYDVLVASDAAAVGANLQHGKWLAQVDTPDTAMTHYQRQKRIDRVGQTGPVELLDFVAQHPAETRARERLAKKYELRSIVTSPLGGLDDSGVAGILHRIRAEKRDAEEPLHQTVAEEPEEPEDDGQGGLFGAEPEPEGQGGLFGDMPMPEPVPEGQGALF